LMNIEKKSIDRLSEALQTASFVPDQWMVALEALARATNSSHAELVCWTRPNKTPLKLISNLSDAQAALIRNWEARVGDDPAINPIVAKGVRMPVLDVLTDEDVIGSAERARHIVWNEHYDKIDMPHLCFSPLWRSSGSVLGLFLLRSSSDGPVKREERQLFGHLAGRWRDAALTARVLKEEGARVLAGALNSLSIHALFLDGMGRCTGLSLGAESLVSAGALLTVRNDRPRLANGLKTAVKCPRRQETIALDPDLQPCIDCVTRLSVSPASHQRACSIMVSERSGFVAHLRISSISRHHHEICFGAAAIMVVEPLEARSSAELLPEVIAMLTPAEREIATELVNGSPRRHRQPQGRIDRDRPNPYQTYVLQAASIQSGRVHRSRSALMRKSRPRPSMVMAIDTPGTAVGPRSSLEIRGYRNTDDIRAIHAVKTSPLL
jgi:hypothetical protein